MQYKTIVLELLEQRKELYDQLRKSRLLLPTMETLATELRDHHIEMTESLTRAHPDSNPSQIPAERLELVVKDLEDCLPTVTPQDEQEPLTLAQAMAFVRSHLSKA